MILPQVGGIVLAIRQANSIICDGLQGSLDWREHVCHMHVAWCGKYDAVDIDKTIELEPWHPHNRAWCGISMMKRVMLPGSVD